MHQRPCSIVLNRQRAFIPSSFMPTHASFLRGHLINLDHLMFVADPWSMHRNLENTWKQPLFVACLSCGIPFPFVLQGMERRGTVEGLADIKHMILSKKLNWRTDMNCYIFQNIDKLNLQISQASSWTLNWSPGPPLEIPRPSSWRSYAESFMVGVAWV